MLLCNIIFYLLQEGCNPVLELNPRFAEALHVLRTLEPSTSEAGTSSWSTQYLASSCWAAVKELKFKLPYIRNHAI